MTVPMLACSKVEIYNLKLRKSFHCTCHKPLPSGQKMGSKCQFNMENNHIKSHEAYDAERNSKKWGRSVHYICTQ